jgi:hypothetical protein
MYRISNTLGHQDIRSNYPADYRVVKIGVGNQTRTAADPRAVSVLAGFCVSAGSKFMGEVNE